MICDVEFHLIQQALPAPESHGMCYVQGLNLNIVVPTDVDVGELREGLLPVAVFIHGGNWAPHIDMSRLVSYSASIGKPMIGVAINY